MNSKIALAGLFVLLLNACDSNEPATQPAMPEQKTPPVEEVKPQVSEQPVISEQPVMEEVKPQMSEAPAVASVAEPTGGEAIYKKTCKSCHDTGAANAPKLGDKAAWKPRIEKGMDALMQSALNGVPGTAMMKRGTCLSCSDEDLKAAIEYMVEKSQ